LASRKKTKSYKRTDKTENLLIEAREALDHGQVIGFPTETFYGLGVDAFNAKAVARLVTLKGRDPKSPIPIIVADEKMLSSVVTTISPVARRLIERFWPGPLTLVLPGNPGLPRPLLNCRGGIGVRVSSHPIAQRLVSDLGRPITATSANPSGRAPARTWQEVLGYFAARIAVIIDGGRLQGKKGSTVVEVFEDQTRLIREGEIRPAALHRALRVSS
jgi:L-threonylcarbamoyladenylate synthase